MTVGCISAWRSGRAQRKAQPLGAHSHLWPLPTYQSAPKSFSANGIMPGAWAPSTNTGTPLCFNNAISRAMGNTRAVSEPT